MRDVSSQQPTHDNHTTEGLQVYRVRVLCVAMLATVATFGVPGFASAEECIASWYGPGFHGKAMANTETFNQDDPTVVAHKTLPFGTKVRVTDLNTGKSVQLVVQDRGPFEKGRCVDLSKAAADKLGFRTKGITRVRVDRL